ncbi:unnamed protein product [Periconia digitata]|uniref:Uncharacterized protein n=1 Tax=Periconia digitata TaxID=1303443 RepID=A0A9W4XUN3_9PLEO|nr:unnamed protein product [Periconia digitata]
METRGRHINVPKTKSFRYFLINTILSSSSNANRVSCDWLIAVGSSCAGGGKLQPTAQSLSTSVACCVPTSILRKLMLVASVTRILSLVHQKKKMKEELDGSCLFFSFPFPSFPFGSAASFPRCLPRFAFSTLVRAVHSTPTYVRTYMVDRSASKG